MHLARTIGPPRAHRDGFMAGARGNFVPQLVIAAKQGRPPSPPLLSSTSMYVPYGTVSLTVRTVLYCM